MSPRLLDRAALGVAIIALLMIGIRPTSERLVDQRSVVLRAPGATAAEAKAVADSLGGIAVIDLSLAGMPRSAERLHVVGWGLDEGELRQVGDRSVVFHPRLLPDGIRQVSWSSSVALGDPLEVRATVRTPRREVLVLLAESGEADSVVIPGGRSLEVALRHTPRAVGSARYALRLGALADTFSVLVGASVPPRVLILGSAPSREWSDLRDWLARQGGSVALRTGVSRDRSRLDRVNLPANASTALDRMSLRGVALLVTDGRTLARSSRAERAALGEAIRGGLGLVTILDREARDPSLLPPADGALFHPWTVKSAGDLDERQVRPRLRGEPISPTPIAAEGVVIGSGGFGSAVLLDDGQGGALAMTTSQGMGRIVGTVVTGPGRWLRGGEREAFGIYWSTLIRAAARPDPMQPRWEGGEGPVMVDRETPLVRWGPGESQVTIANDTVILAADPLLSGRYVGRWWPRSEGWNGSEGVKVWVAGGESWNTWQAAERRRETERWMARRGPLTHGGDRRPLRSPWPLWPFFALFVTATAWLWRVRH